MAGLAFVSKLLLVENVFCIFRNFYFLKKKFSYVAVVWAVVELIINVISLYLGIEALLWTSINMDTLFVFQFGLLSNINAILVILLGFKNANSFRVLYSLIDATCDVLKESTAFRKSLNKAKNFALILTVIFICNYMTLLTFYLKNFYVVSRIENPNKYSRAVVLTFLFDTFVMICCEIRYFIEFVSIIVLISVLRACLKNVHFRMSKTVNSLRKRSIESATHNEIDQIRDNLKKWFMIFCNLDKCVFYMKKCFGIQVWFSLFTIIIYFIFLSYIGIKTLMVEGTEDNIGNKNTVFLLSNYSMVIISMLYGGQKAQNEANSLKRALAQLSNILVTTPGDDAVELRKLVKDFHRCVTIEPFRIEFMSTVFIQMPLLPIILTAVISHTIILLQFNHVV